MVGKPNVPVDADRRPDAHGAAVTTPGMTALDEEREASMADEGGASGMAAERQDQGDELDELDDIDETLGIDLLVVGGVFVAGAVVGMLMAGLFRRG